MEDQSVVLAHRYQHVLQRIDGKRLVLESDIELVHAIYDFVRQVIYGDEKYRTYAKGRDGKTRGYVSKSGQHLSHLNTYAAAFVSGYQYHPYLSFFFKTYREHSIRLAAGLSPMSIVSEGQTVWELFDDYVAVMRDRAKAENLKKVAADWESKNDKNFARALKLEERLFQSYARLMVIRLDLHHKAELFQPDDVRPYMDEAYLKRVRDRHAFQDGEDLSGFEPLRGRVSFETVQRDRERFFANMKGKPSLFQHLVGYIWRIEFARGAGYHLHVVLFFDGSKTQKHVDLARKTGLWWTHDVTQGRGYFHNTNAEWDEMDSRCGIGMINHHDHAKRKNLRERVLKYLCKPEQMVYVLPYPGANTFGSSTLPKPHSGLGRPRSKVQISENHQGALSEATYPRSSYSLGINDLQSDEQLSRLGSACGFDASDEGGLA